MLKTPKDSMDNILQGVGMGGGFNPQALVAYGT